MNTVTRLAMLFGLLASLLRAQDKVEVSGTPIPAQLLEQNYGKMPKNVGAFDLNLCNVSGQRQTLLSSQIFHELSQSNILLTPIGRQIMLASILRNQRKSFGTALGVALNAAVGVAALLGTSHGLPIPANVTSGIALGAILLRDITRDLQPMLPADKLEKFDREVLEPALVLEPGACAERTVFTVLAKPAARASALRFRVH